MCTDLTAMREIKECLPKIGSPLSNASFHLNMNFLESPAPVIVPFLELSLTLP